MRLRKQKHRFSCGLACVATLANKPYSTVLADFRKMKKGRIEHKLFNDRWIIDYGTTTSDLHRLLKKYGIEAGQRCTTYQDSHSLPDVSILAVRARRMKVGTRMGDCWHWVVARRNGRRIDVYDPLKGTVSLKNVCPVESYLRIYG